jgi:hypothetical protein
LLLTLRFLLQRIPLNPLDINCLYFLEYNGIPPDNIPASRSRAEIRNATLMELEELTRCENTPRQFLNRFHAKDYCVVAVREGRIVGYEWATDKPYCKEERYSYRIEIPPDAIYLYDCFILPEFRLVEMIWLKFVSLYMGPLMQRLGREKIITMIDYGNRISMNTHLRFGFQLTRKVFVLRAFGKSFFLESTVPRDKVTLPRLIPIAGKTRTRPASELNSVVIELSKEL